MQDYEIWSQETRNIALSYGVEISIDYYFVLSQCTRLTDRQTDRHTDRQTDICLEQDRVRMRSQSHGKNGLVFMARPVYRIQYCTKEIQLSKVQDSLIDRLSDLTADLTMNHVVTL